MGRWPSTSRRLAVTGLLLLGACATSSGGAATKSPAASPQDKRTPVPISTSSWRPGDPGRAALIRGTLTFTAEGCPRIGSLTSVVWPTDYTSIVTSDGQHVVVTADGRQIAAGDTIVTGGAIAGSTAGPGMPCIEAGTVLTSVESAVQVIPGG